jgi:hypothetical protein
MYDHTADAFRNRETVLHNFATFTQLASIEGSTLRAPEGEPDDRADAYALGCTAARITMGLYINRDLITNSTLEPERQPETLVFRSGGRDIEIPDLEDDYGKEWWQR